MSDADALREFARFLEVTKAGGDDPLLAFLPEDQAFVARVCAIPHEFDLPTILAAIPDVPAETVETTVKLLSTNATVSPTATGYLLHDAVRRRLFSKWFSDPAFPAISRRLANYYAGRKAIETNGRLPVLERRRVFHLIGANRGEGVDAVVHLCTSARERFEFTNCSNMIGLAHEYDPVLASSERLALVYEEAKVAADLANWHQAAELLRAIIEDPEASDEMRVRALNRMGLIEDAQHRSDEGLTSFKKALELATRHDVRKEIPSVSINMANALRDVGQIDEALHCLTSAAEEAEELRDEDAVAAARNAAGLIYYRRGEYGKAIDNFSEVTGILFRRDRTVALAGVQANLGLAYAGALQWVDSEAAFRKSLEVYSSLGASDPYARALSGLARTVYAQQRLEEALQIAATAEKLFVEIGRPFEAGTTARDAARWLVGAGRVDNARQLYAVAADHFRAAETPHEIAVTQSELASVGNEKFPLVLRICGWIGILLFAIFIIWLFAN